MDTSSPRSNQPRRLLLALAIVTLVATGALAYRWWNRRSGARFTYLQNWFQSPEKHADWSISAGSRCEQAPFLLPTDGYIGFLWGDSFRPGHTHQGIDIFGGSPPGQVPVVAAHDGYLTRLSNWKSAVILRVSLDPLQPERQIWLYYTHMADQNGNSYIAPEYPPGSSEVFVRAGTFLGYQGNYSGDPDQPTGVHLHFSIVRDDGNGSFTNELEFKNTIDPSPYLGLPLNALTNRDTIPVCQEEK